MVRFVKENDHSSDSQEQHSIHMIIAKQFQEWCLDIPFVLLFPLLLWRIPLTARLLLGTRAAIVGRAIVYQQFIEVLQDLPYVPPAIVLFVSLIRLPDVILHV